MFTRGDEGGNHLGVVDDIVGLDPVDMQRIAADLGFSETIFVDWQDRGVPSVRIFTPATELPFAGHPLVGAAWTMLRLGPGGVTRLRCGIGEVAVGLDGDAAWVEIDVDPATAHRADLDELAERAEMPTPDGGHVVQMPNDYLLVRYRDAVTVAGLAPDLAVLAEHFGTLAYARDGDRVRARFFAPGAGVPEDPATGSAAVALATALVSEGEAAGALTIDQGAEMGHPSRIVLSWNAPVVRISGTCVRDEARLLDM